MNYKEKINQLQSDRINFETLWCQIGNLTSSKDKYFTDGYTSGIKGETISRNFDTTARRAINKCTSSLVSLITPQSQRWHTVSVADDKLAESENVRKYLQEVTDTLFSYRYINSSRFNIANYSAINSFVTFGNGALYPIINEDRTGIIYKKINMSNVYFSQDRFDNIDCVMLCHTMTKQAALDFFGSAVMEDIKDSTGSDFQFKELIHKITGNEDVSKGRYKSCWFFNGKYDSVLKTNYHNSMPVIIARDVSSVHESYGRGITEEALAEIVNLETQRKLNLKGLAYAVDPPLASVGIGNATGHAGAYAGGMRFNLKPGGITLGGVSADGRPLIQPINTGVNPSLGYQFMVDSREIINDHFHLGIFSILGQDNPNMTATEALIRDQEKANMLTPILSILESEYLTSLIQRELDFLDQLGKLPPRPVELESTEIKVKYQSPMSASQNSSKIVAATQTLELLVQIANFYPSALNFIDFGEFVNQVAIMNNTPIEILRNKEEAEQMTAQQEDTQQRMAQQELLNTASASTKNFAEAQAIQRGS